MSDDTTPNPEAEATAEPATPETVVVDVVETEASPDAEVEVVQNTEDDESGGLTEDTEVATDGEAEAEEESA